MLVGPALLLLGVVGCQARRKRAVARAPARAPAAELLSKVEAAQDPRLAGGVTMPLALVALPGDDALLLWQRTEDAAVVASRPGQPAFEVLPALGGVPPAFSLEPGDAPRWPWTWDGEALQLGDGHGFWARVAADGVRARGRVTQDPGAGGRGHVAVAMLGTVAGQSVRLVGGRAGARWLERWHDGAWQRWREAPAQAEPNLFHTAAVQWQGRVGWFEASGAHWRVHLMGPDQSITSHSEAGFAEAAAVCPIEDTSLLALATNGLTVARVDQLMVRDAPSPQHLVDGDAVQPDLVVASCDGRLAVVTFGVAAAGLVYLAASNDGGRTFQRLQGGAERRGRFVLVGDPMRLRLYYARGEAHELVRRVGSFGAHGFAFGDEVRLGRLPGALTAGLGGDGSDVLVSQDQFGVPTLYRAARGSAW